MGNTVSAYLTPEQVQQLRGDPPVRGDKRTHSARRHPLAGRGPFNAPRAGNLRGAKRGGNWIAASTGPIVYVMDAESASMGELIERVTFWRRP